MLVGLIIIILIGAIVFRFTRKPEGPPPTRLESPIIRQDSEQTQPKSFDFSGMEAPDLPKELPVYNIQPYNITETGATTLASNLGFSGTPSSVRENTLDGKEFSFSQDDLRLTLSQTSVEYRDLGSQVPTAEGALSFEQLKEKVDSFIDKIAILGEIELQNTQFQIVSEDHGRYTENFQEAQVVEFSFDKKLSGIPIVNNYPGSALTSVAITRNGEVSRLFSRFFDKFIGQDTYELQTINEAMAQLEAGQGKIIQVRITNDEQPPSFEEYEYPEDINTAKIEKAFLAYFLPSDIKETVQPIFVFEGGFETTQGENGKVVIYLPAIKQDK